MGELLGYQADLIDVTLIYCILTGLVLQAYTPCGRKQRSGGAGSVGKPGGVRGGVRCIRYTTNNPLYPYAAMPLKKSLLALALMLALSPVQADTASKTFTVVNTGNGELNISAATISGNTADYSLTGNTCGPVPPGEGCALTVTFSPTEVGDRPAASLTFTSDGSNGPNHSISLSGAGAPNEIVYTLSANASDVNMAALFGSPTVPRTYILNIDPGVAVSATSTSTAALTTGAFPEGSIVKIVNKGYIFGKGGDGGAGGAAHTYTDVNGAYCYTQPSGPAPGQAGGPALALQTSVSIDNTYGYIFGGGGGGGGTHGGMYWKFCAAGGNGGGGGGGGGSGGSGGAASGATNTGCSYAWNGSGMVGNYSWGGASNLAGNPGGLISGGALRQVSSGNDIYRAEAGAGGAGGTYGQPGQAGAPSYAYTQSASGCADSSVELTSYLFTPAPGGAAGSAVLTNGKPVNWLGGNDGTRVKGPVQ